jgi:exopolyphosphatase / guanosine-5'-triphosphate,3'-diphosphate pyrophosphatase
MVTEAGSIDRVAAVSSGDLVAALDLGSNSFHLIVAQLRGDEVHVVDRHRETVRLASGLKADGELSKQAQTAALECLERMAQRLRTLPAGCVRVVGTNTLRRARRSDAFLRRAVDVLGHPIQVISGIEEARLIYGGVVRDMVPGVRRLVLDVGGGSTELIVGDSDGPRQLESLYMGCVSCTHRHFDDGRITRKRIHRAVMDARVELEPVIARFRGSGWSEVWGASGTFKAVDEAACGIGQDGITPTAIADLQQACIELGHIDTLSSELEISAERAPVFIGGLCVVSGLVEALGIERITPAGGALREGLLYELIGRIQRNDVRTGTVARLQDRYVVDVGHASRVAATAMALLDRVREDWDLGAAEASDLLRWACELHEIGLAIAHSGYHRHGEYVLRHADLPGFSRDEQAALATLVRSHRRKIARDVIALSFPPYDCWIPKLACLIRLAVILNRSRVPEPAPIPVMDAGEAHLELAFGESWIAARPLTDADLSAEVQHLEALGIEMSYA